VENSDGKARGHLSRNAVSSEGTKKEKSTKEEKGIVDKIRKKTKKLLLIPSCLRDL
jgi:hypothetical protein